MDLSYILNWIYPPRCVFCDDIIPLKAYNGFNVCNNCKPYIPFMTEPTCNKCGKQVKLPNTICNECLKKDHSYERGFIALDYDGMTKEAIYRFKYKNQPLYSKTLAELMYQAAFKKAILNYKFDYITAVPLYPTRLKKRGYNQAELLAKDLSLKLNIEYRVLLKRTKDTKPQNSLSPKQRYNNLKGAFELNTNTKLINKTILIVDDIITTGSTIEECSNRLIDRNTDNKIYYYILSGTSFC